MSPRDVQRETALPKFSLNRRITVLVLFATTLVVGAIAAIGIPLELFPAGFSAPFLQVYIPYNDAPPKEVEQKVTLPLEAEISTVKGISQLVSVSRYGAAISFIEFKQSTDMDVAYREVRDRVERAKVEFPAGVDRAFVQKFNSSGIPVLVLGVAVDSEVTDLYNLVQDQIVKPMSRIDGVANIQLDGMEEKEILIELDRRKVAASGLNIYQLAQDLGGDNFTMSSGTVREGADKLALRSIARYDSVEALRQRKVGPSVRLGDIATIRYEEEEKDYRARAMSEPAFALVVMKEGDANATEVCRKLVAQVERMKSDPRLSGFESIVLFNQGAVIEESLATMLQSGMIGGIIAGMVLFLFLRRFRMTLIVSLSIPLSLLIGLTVMFFAGETLNFLTLLGLMLCVGLLVDNSVVVAENIYRQHRAGAERRHACIHGAGEVALAITMSTLTTIVVFLPVSLVEGPGQFFLTRLAIPVCVSLAASLLVALVFIPLCVYLTLPAAATTRTASEPGRGTVLFLRFHERLNGIMRRIYDVVFGRLNRNYNKMLAFFLARRLDLVISLLVVFVITAALPMKEVKVVESQDEEAGGFSLFVEMPPSSTLEEAETWFLGAEQTIEGMQEELGLEGWFLSHDEEDGELHGWFDSPHSVKVTAREATERVKEELHIIPGMEVFTGQESETEDESSIATYPVMLYGEDIDILEETAQNLEKMFLQIDGVLGLQRRSDPPPNELGLVVDRELAQRYQVNPQVIAGVVGYALRGADLPKYYDDGKEIPVRIRFQEEDRENLNNLENFLVPTQTGSAMPLSALTDATFLPARNRIFRLDKRALRRITLELEEGTEDETKDRLASLSSRIDLPEGVTLGANVTSVSFNDDVGAMFFAALLSVVFIYLLMGFLFESFILPLSIILTIPLSIIGVYWMHFAAGKDLDMLGIVGIVLLIGVVVNNGIVLIDYVNRLRAGGMSRTEALAQATDRRFRPIMMTAITTIGGMIPLALAGSGGGDDGLSYTSFSMTLIGGMTTATLLTLLVVPVFYTFFDDAREVLTETMKRSLGKGVRLKSDPVYEGSGSD